jgi:hypothetical protein
MITYYAGSAMLDAPYEFYGEGINALLVSEQSGKDEHLISDYVVGWRGWLIGVTDQSPNAVREGRDVERWGTRSEPSHLVGSDQVRERGLLGTFNDLCFYAYGYVEVTEVRDDLILVRDVGM